MSSVLRVARSLVRPTRLQHTRAFHSPFAVLADKVPTTRTSIAASDYELEYAARTVYVVSDPEPVDGKYGVPAGAYPVGVPYDATGVSSDSQQVRASQTRVRVNRKLMTFVQASKHA
jgi:hypothetical protein